MMRLSWLLAAMMKCFLLDCFPRLDVSLAYVKISLAFEFEKLHEQQRNELLRKSLTLLEGKEFTDILIPCIGEAIDRFSILMQKPIKEELWKRLSALKGDKELSEIQRFDLKRITDKIY